VSSQLVMRALHAPVSLKSWVQIALKSELYFFRLNFTPSYIHFHILTALLLCPTSLLLQ